MTLIVPEISDQAAWDDVPGVEVVLGATDEQRDVLLTPLALKLMNVLERRTAKRRQAIRQRRLLHATNGSEPSASLQMNSPAMIADLAGSETWHDRLDAALAGSTTPGVVQIRGWEDTEGGVLVDGRPVVAAIFDLAITLVPRVDELRSGECSIVVLLPRSVDDDSARLWPELIRLAEDRLGIERGTVRYTTSVITTP